MDCLISSTALPILLLSILFRLSSTNSSPSPKSLSFSTPLIHVNSPESPFYDPSLTHADLSRLAARATRARIRARNHALRLNAYTAPVVPRVPIAGQYYMKYKIGDPPIETYGVPDTGSELIWLQCLPCKRCYKQPIPIFDSARSSSYNKILCTDNICKSSEQNVECKSGDTFCSYDVSYEDGSYTVGDVASETITLQDDTIGGIIKLTNMVIGCGHNNTDYNETLPDMPPGLIGLDRGNLSLVTQLGFKQFSHCISTAQDPASGHSLLKIGQGSTITGPETHTPLNPHPTGWYFVNILGIIVGDVKLDIPPSVFQVNPQGTRGTIIDTGTNFFELVHEAFDPLVEEIKFQMEVIVELKPIENPDYELCYADVKFAPKIVILFEGLDFEISNANTWDQVAPGQFCLTIFGGSETVSMFGMFMMRDVNVGYDLANNVVSLANTACPLIK